VRKHPWIRTSLLVVLLVAVWATSAYVVPLTDGSQNPPADPLGTAAKDILQAARKKRAKEIFPRRYVSADDAIKRARFEMNLQMGTHWGARDFDRPTALMDQAQGEAFGLYRDTVRHQEETRELAGEAIAAAQKGLDESREVAKVGQQQAAIRVRLTTAEVSLREARARFKESRYDEAVKSAQKSIREVDLAHKHYRQLLARFNDPRQLSTWQSWIRQAVNHSRSTGGVAFVVIKEKHRLDVYRGGRLSRSVPVDIGANFANQKVHAGDRATPEGYYRVTQKKGRGATKYNLALLLNYPNDEDRRRFQAAKNRGELSRRTGIGGLIEIHGDGGRGYDWTDGCVAPDDDDMRVLYNMAQVGTPVAIVGSDGTEGPVRSTLRMAENRVYER
jgi:L,D-peptidoglycan transpeptidase YkuD (ErfK/YbiS/YcfS/YnhG family)